MAYKYSKGKTFQGDIYNEDDTQRNTYIDFGDDDYIGLVASGSSVLVVSGSKVGIGTTSPDYTLHVAGNVGLDEYIYHNGDGDTWMRLVNNGMTFKAGGLSFINLDKKGSAPHELTFNDGSNNIDFIVKGNGSRGGNPGMKFDASTNKVGINGVGTPEESLHVDGNIKLFGDDVRIKIDGDTDSHPGLELYENGTRKWIVYNNYTNDNLTFKTDSSIRMSIQQDGNVGIGTQSPASTLEVNGSFSKDIITITGTSNNVDATQSTVLMNAASGHCSAQLPAVAGTSGRIYTFKRIDSDESNGCKIQTNGSETIDGNSADYELDTQYNVLTIQSNGSAWYIINEVHMGHGG